MARDSLYDSSRFPAKVTARIGTPSYGEASLHQTLGRANIGDTGVQSAWQEKRPGVPLRCTLCRRPDPQLHCITEAIG